MQEEKTSVGNLVCRYHQWTYGLDGALLFAEHMGKVTWSSTEVANFCVDPSDPATALVTGTMIVTAANGDLVTQSYTTTVNADFGAGTLTATGNYVVTGGTGRFTGATGGGTVDVTGSLAPPFGVSGTFAGTIAY